VHNAVTEDQAIGSNHFRHGQSRGNLHCGNTRLFEFCRNRSAAASARASRGREDDRVYAKTLGPLRHLPAHAPGVG
jgi:hypothetical protein